MDFLRQVKSGDPIGGRVVLVLAHPDDETASAAVLLQRLSEPRLIYLTDGAPRDLIDARREGCADWRAYAEMRRLELRAALDAVGIEQEPAFYGCPDKQALEHLERLVERLTNGLAEAAVVITHAYEHGHPDHDTAAVAVELACQKLGRAAPERIEFASYHLGKDGPVYGRFYGGEGQAIVPTPEELRRKQGALNAYSSQRDTLSLFPLSPERFRAAPRYDFAEPAPPGVALYDLYGWDVTGERWRSRLAGLIE